MFSDIYFADPYYLFLLALVPFFIAWYVWQNRYLQPEIKLPSTSAFSTLKLSYKQPLRHALFVLRMIGYSALVLAIARPQSSSVTETVSTEGIDIMLALDISGSMLSKDFYPNRVGAAKKVAEDFIEGRPNDRIGLVIFSGEAYTECPVTIDHSVLENQLNGIQIGDLSDGTAIGMGLGTAINRLKDSKAKTKVIILMTDGVNNMGFIDPLTAGELAQKMGIRVYTIGIGTNGIAPFPVMLPNGQIGFQNGQVEIGEDLLKQIATMTGGQYFRATDEKKLATIYRQIDKMEKTKIDVNAFKHHKEEYFWFAFAAALALLLEILLRNTVLRSIP
jgi:Ca-activated chloride channel homolog